MFVEQLNNLTKKGVIIVETTDLMSQEFLNSLKE
jgi:hypothetical protein